MTAPDRIPCIKPGCRRTAPAEKYAPGTEIVCAKCWRDFVPVRMKRRYKMLRRAYSMTRRKNRPDPVRLGRIGELLDMNWRAIRRAVIQPKRPAGLDTFLEETGL